MVERGGDRELLLGIFLMEAWDTAAALEEGLAGLPADSAAAARAVAPLVVVAHRLKGSAALHGFPGVSELAAVTEQLLERLPTAAPPDRARARGFVAELVPVLKEVFDRISVDGREDAERIAAFKSRHPEFFAGGAAAGAALPAPAAPPESRQASGEAYRMVRELERFFADSGDALMYFGPEAAEHLETMTQALLALEAGRSEQDLHSLFRAAHTLKGAAYTVGCTPVGDVAHQMEDLLVAVREHRVPFGPAVVEACLSGLDALRLVLEGGGRLHAGLGEALERTLESLKAAAEAREPSRPVVERQAAEAGNLQRATGPGPALLSAVSRPDASRPADAARLAAARAAEAAAAAALPGLMPRPDFLARLEALPRPTVERAPAGPGGPTIRVSLERLDALMNLVGELMIARSRLDRRLAQLDRVGELLLFSRARMGQAVRQFEGRHHFPRLSGTRRDRGAGGGFAGAPLAELFAELEFDRYDDFNILARGVAEMSNDIAEVQSQQAALIRAIREDVAQIQRLTGTLRKEVTRARMVPIGRLFTRFARQVREAARAAGKAVALEVQGEATEVDNTIIEQIADPLLHLIQNAVAHGIEPAAERLERGKPAQGVIRLRAYHRGSFMFIEVEDDGRGMDPAALRRQAVELGLASREAAEAMTDSAALDLIFLPGFSTAAEVTRAAGRGVGMDVVRTNVSRLNGEVAVETDVGVRTRFTLKLPLTVAIADALLVRVSGEVLAFPLSAVSEMRLPEPGELTRAGNREMVRIGGQTMELFRLERVLDLAGGDASRQPVVVLRGGGEPFAVAVDDLLGKEEIVVKGLGRLLEGVGPFSGATISGEGRVILLLDPARLREAGRRAVARPAAPAAPRAEEIERRVMLVDDSISVRKVVGQMLEKAGLKVFAAVDGQDALQQLTDLTVHVVVTDLEMPRINGYQLIEDLRRRPGTREVPIVVLTTRAAAKHVNLARRLGVRHYVTKPVDEHSFVRLVESLAVGQEAAGAVEVSGAA